MEFDLSTFLFILFVFVFGFKMGEMFFSLRIREAVKIEAHRQGFTTDEDEDIIVRKMIVEENDNQLFLYDFDDKEFICQGHSVQELAKKAKANRGINVAVVVHNKECYYFINGDIKSSL
jgi:hypothetical protein